MLDLVEDHETRESLQSEHGILQKLDVARVLQVEVRHLASLSPLPDLSDRGAGPNRFLLR